MLCTLKLYNAICQIYFNKAERKKEYSNKVKQGDVQWPAWEGHFCLGDEERQVSNKTVNQHNKVPIRNVVGVSLNIYLSEKDNVKSLYLTIWCFFPFRQDLYIQP